jgi:hypothetical protein
LTQSGSGDWILEVSVGDEHHPSAGTGDGWENVQMPLTRESAQLLARALNGEVIDNVDERDR